MTPALAAALAADAVRIDEALEILLPRRAGPEERLREAMRYACLGGGKRLRPFLVLEGLSLVDFLPLPILDATTTDSSRVPRNQTWLFKTTWRGWPASCTRRSTVSRRSRRSAWNSTCSTQPSAGSRNCATTNLRSCGCAAP